MSLPYVVLAFLQLINTSYLLIDYLASLVQTFLCAGILLDCNSLGILLRYVRNPFPMLGQSGRG